MKKVMEACQQGNGRLFGTDAEWSVRAGMANSGDKSEGSKNRLLPLP